MERMKAIVEFSYAHGVHAASAHFNLAQGSIYSYRSFLKNGRNSSGRKPGNSCCNKKVEQSEDSLIAEYRNCEKRMAEIVEAIKARHETLAKILGNFK